MSFPICGPGVAFDYLDAQRDYRATSRLHQSGGRFCTTAASQLNLAIGREALQ
jgi:hypothetical protein